MLRVEPVAQGSAKSARERAIGCAKGRSDVPVGGNAGEFGGPKIPIVPFPLRRAIGRCGWIDSKAASATWASFRIRPINGAFRALRYLNNRIKHGRLERLLCSHSIHDASVRPRGRWRDRPSSGRHPLWRSRGRSDPKARVLISSFDPDVPVRDVVIDDDGKLDHQRNRDRSREETDCDADGAAVSKRMRI